MSSYPNLSQDEMETMTLFFQYLDTDHDGLVSIDEIREACGVDIDGDGVITEVEKTASAAPWPVRRTWTAIKNSTFMNCFSTTTMPSLPSALARSFVAWPNIFRGVNFGTLDS